MGCSDDRSIQVDHEETNQEQDNPTNEKVFEDFEEYKSKKIYFLKIYILYFYL